MTIADIISENTLVPIGVAVAIFIAIGSYTAWISKQFRDVGDKIMSQGANISERLQRLEFKIEERFTKDDFRRWEREFFRANPTLRPPEDGP